MPISDLLASITGEQTSAQSYVPSPSSQKRKADGDLRISHDKIVKKEGSQASQGRPIATATRPSTLNVSIKQGSTAKPSALQSSSTSASLSAASAPASSNASTAPAKAPKKGSFAEIMARGKVAAATMGQVGKIQHKPIERLSQRERVDERRAQKAGSAKLSAGKPSSGVKAQPLDRNNKNRGTGVGRPTAKPMEPEKKVKKAALATTGYTGTARPVPGKSSSSGGSRLGGSASRERERVRPGQSHRRDEYLATDDEEDDMEEDEEAEDYYSDASSDMEAATFEVDEEEERAARIARKEDAAALAEENRLKREKEEKRKRLAAMARSRR